MRNHTSDIPHSTKTTSFHYTHTPYMLYYYNTIPAISHHIFGSPRHATQFLCYSIIWFIFLPWWERLLFNGLAVRDPSVRPVTEKALHGRGFSILSAWTSMTITVVSVCDKNTSSLSISIMTKPDRSIIIIDAFHVDFLESTNYIISVSRYIIISTFYRWRFWSRVRMDTG